MTKDTKKTATEVQDKDLDNAVGGFTLNEELLAWWQAPKTPDGAPTSAKATTRHYDPDTKQVIVGKSE